MSAPIYLIDVDGTLCHTEEWTVEGVRNAEPNIRLIEKVNELHKNNFIIIYTARVDDLIPATLEWLRRHNVRYHAISNLKVPTDFYVDDKAVYPMDFVNGGKSDEEIF